MTDPTLSSTYCRSDDQGVRVTVRLSSADLAELIRTGTVDIQPGDHFGPVGSVYVAACDVVLV